MHHDIRKGCGWSVGLAAAMACGLLGACAEEVTYTDGGCVTDNDCLSGLTCNTTSGACKCTTNDSCLQAYPDQNMYCNTFGDCQPRPSCVDNRDCADKPGTFCNTVSGTCIAEAPEFSNKKRKVVTHP